MNPDGPAQPGSVSQILPPLREGHPAAVGALWRYFYQSLVEVAARRLDDALHAAIGPEDVAQEALLEFCAALARPDSGERFPRLGSRADLWRVLVCITVRRACDVRVKYHRRLQVVAGESAAGPAGLQACPDHGMPAGFRSAVDDLLALLPDDTHRQVALMRMEGYSNEQIAEKIGRAVTTVEVKLKTIRAVLKPVLADNA